jgi:hypothetical protein
VGALAHFPRRTLQTKEGRKGLSWRGLYEEGHIDESEVLSATRGRGVGPEGARSPFNGRLRQNHSLTFLHYPLE